MKSKKNTPDKEENIIVAIRVRPEFDKEYPDTCEVFTDQLVVTPPSVETLKDLIAKKKCKNFRMLRRRTQGYKKQHIFKYDRIFGPETKQEQVYKSLGGGVVSNCLSGYNACIFAYGQTGSGKSHTMMGPSIGCVEEDLGIIPRLCDELFSTIKVKSEENKLIKYIIKTSMIEIYNERIKDLLNPHNIKHNGEKGLSIREHPTKGWYIPDITFFEVSDSVQIQDLIAIGARNRTIAKTKMNDTSSRAHTVFQIKMIKRETFMNKTGNKVLYESDTSSLVNLIDLAGSEQMGTAVGDYKEKIENYQQREKELIAINVSLSSLGLVITKLAKQANNPKIHIPYRNSKLTKLLSDSLGGNSKTIMIATLSANPFNYDQTISTCKYADRVKSIKNKPIINADPKDKIIQQLRLRIDELKRRNGGLNEEDFGLLGELKMLNQDMTQSMEELKKKNEMQRQMHVSTNQHLRDKNNRLKLKIEEKDQQINELNDSHLEFDEMSKGMQLKMNEYEMIIKKLTEENERLKLDVSSKDLKIKHLEETVQSLNEKQEMTSMQEAERESSFESKCLDLEAKNKQNEEQILALEEKLKSQTLQHERSQLELTKKYDLLKTQLGDKKTEDKTLIIQKQMHISKELTGISQNLKEMENRINQIWNGD